MPDIVDTGWRPNKNAISVFLFMCAAGILVAGLAGMLGVKFSITRLALLSAAVLVSGGFCILGWQIRANTHLTSFWQRRANSQAQTGLIVATALLALAGWTMIWTPLESFGGLFYYIQGLYPWLVWLTCVCLGALGLLLAARFGFNIHRWKEIRQNQRITFLVAGGSLLIFGLLAWIASQRILNVKPADEDFWYGAGAPILAFQVLGALIAGLAISMLIQKYSIRVPWLAKHADLLIFLVIWALTAWLWASTPVKSDFLITRPVAPNFEMYPDYDARNYDLMSQFALLGQGINNFSFFDRVLYPAFLVYLHTLAGQDYARLMALQAAIFAVLPAILYFIGKRLHSRAAGLTLGILIALRGVSHLDVGNIIETAHQKHMLTEFPTAVLLVLATFLLVKWAKNPSKHWPLAGLAGAVISLSTLLRPHPLALLPVIIALAVFIYRKRARMWMGLSALVISSALLGILPWLQFGGQNVSIVSLYMTRIKSIIEQRYPQLLPPQGSLPEPVTARTTGTAHLALISLTPVQEKSVLAFATDNFLNNLVTAIQVLPSTPFNLDARVVVKKTENFWKPYWDGSLTPWARVLIPINLLLIALGLGAAWKKSRLSGLIPLIIMLTYFAVNAFARTSGGRYLVPADWVVVIYYILGLVTAGELALAFFGNTLHQTPENVQNHPETRPGSFWKPAISVLLASACLGALVPLAQKISPLRFQTLSNDQMAEQFIAGAGQNSALSAKDVKNFLSSENAIILEGRSLYPRQFNKDEGLDASIYTYYHSLPYPRTLFTLLGPHGENVVILPRSDAAKIANSVDMLVLGCLADGYVQAWEVLSLQDGSLFTRQPVSALSPTCPLPEPVCDNNKNCH